MSVMLIAVFTFGAIITAVLLVQRRVPIGSAAGLDFATLFRSREDYVSDDGPTEVIHADLTNDGIDEVLVSNAFGDNFSVFHSPNGDGVYEEVTGSPVSTGGFEPNGITTGFFNADAFLDVATANATTDNVSILLGDGDGTFGAPATFAAGDGPEAVRTGDFNGDTFADLIVVLGAFSSNDVAVLLGNGAGSFGAASLITVGNHPIDVQLGLFDAGSVLDAVVSNNADDTVSILLGDGAGSFVPAAPATYPTSNGPWGLRLVQFGGDSNVDILVANVGDNDVTLLSGDGDGTFTAAGTVTVGESPISADMTDLNGDGLLDLVSANQSDATVSTLLQTGGLSFATPVTYSVSNDPYSLFADDINADGLFDVVTASQGDPSFSVFIGDGTGELYGAKSYDFGNGEVGTAGGDFDQDGNADFAIANSFGGTVMVVAGDGAGSFSLLTTEPAGTSPQALASADLDGVNGPDLVAVNSGTNLVSVLLNDGSGGFAAPVGYTVGSVAFPFPSYVALGDLDGVNGPDLVAVSTGSTGQVTVRLNTGSGTFGAPAIYSGLSGPTTVAIGNVDGLGGLDVVAGNSFGSNFWVLLNTGGGVLAPAVSYASGGVSSQIAIGDFNADTLVDVASANFNGANIGISLNNGVGVFGAPTTFATGNLSDPRTADLDADGDLEVYVAQSFPLNSLIVLSGTGTGSFTFGGAYGTGASTRHPLAVDLRANGLLDVVATNSVDNFTHLTNISGTACVELAGPTTVNMVEGSSATLDVVLGSQPNNEVTVSVAAPSGVAASPSSLQFSLGNWDVPQTISLAASDNTVVDGNQTITVALDAASSDSLFAACNAPTITVNVQDNDVTASPNVVRIPGATPQEIAINVSKQAFADGAAPVVVVARADNVVDSLTITPLAGLTHADLLVTNPEGLEPTVQTELQRVLGSNIGTRTVYLAGGEDALTPQVEADLRAAGVTTIVRLGGAHRRETAQKIAEHIVSRNAAPTTGVILAEDERFADALGVGAFAGKVTNGSVVPILLSVRGSGTLDASADAFLTATPSVVGVEILGGAAALPTALADNIRLRHPGIQLSRVEGATRFDTNANFNELHASSPSVIVIANGEQQNLPGATSVSATSGDATGFFSALLAGNFAAGQGAPLLITTAASLPTAIDQYVQRHLSTINTAYIVGSTEKVSTAIEQYLGTLLN